jgi:DNA-binding phage protein
MSALNEWRKNPKFNRLFLQESLKSEFSEIVLGLLKSHDKKISSLAKHVGLKKKKLKRILNGECNISLYLMSDIVDFFNIELGFYTRVSSK